MPANLIVVMGVSGCGKSTVAERLADEFGYEFVEADDFHSPENKAHMASGEALTDAMREPWIDALCAHLCNAAAEGRSCVMSFSGLRAAHRARIRELPFKQLFLHLAGEQTLIYERMNLRKGHFMPSHLLASQYASLQDPTDEPNTVKVNINKSLEGVITEARRQCVKLGRKSKK